MFYTHTNKLGARQLANCLCVIILIDFIFGVGEKN